MTEFATFFQTLLSSVADFLWSDSVRWIVGCVLAMLIVRFFGALLYIRRS